MSLLFEMLRAVGWRELKVVAVVWKRSEGLIRVRGPFPMFFKGLCTFPSPQCWSLDCLWGRGRRLSGLLEPGCWPVASPWTALQRCPSPSSVAAPPPSVTFLHPSSLLPFFLSFPIFFFSTRWRLLGKKNFFKWFNKTLCIILKVNPEFS